ncbi:hypothetical protein COC42_01970 [Sphingomonas spermidinifaciens]|uniref:Uncharacterized protein n=1 Tax=Sphingomonas spermidinifaciens TaxID=1141889 RepID=A0A2A4B554_9SPHN|nr:hypothetical protein COC42_01970 [Sphingomonas spermidinifaciens]
MPVTRSARLLDRGARAGSLADLMTWPRWPALPPDQRERVWRLTALIAARDALPDVIDGATLRGLAAAVGEDRLEAVLDLPPGGDAALPPTTTLGEAGRRIAEAALPAALATRLGHASDRPDAAHHVAAAEEIAA